MSHSLQELNDLFCAALRGVKNAPRFSSPKNLNRQGVLDEIMGLTLFAASGCQKEQFDAINAYIDALSASASVPTQQLRLLCREEPKVYMGLMETMDEIRSLRAEADELDTIYDPQGYFEEKVWNLRRYADGMEWDMERRLGWDRRGV